MIRSCLNLRNLVLGPIKVRSIPLTSGCWQSFLQFLSQVTQLYPQPFSCSYLHSNIRKEIKRRPLLYQFPSHRYSMTYEFLFKFSNWFLMSKCTEHWDRFEQENRNFESCSAQAMKYFNCIIVRKPITFIKMIKQKRNADLLF